MSHRLNRYLPLAVGLVVLTAAGPSWAAPDDLQSLAGDWSGLMPVQPEQHLILHLRKAGDAVSATLDSPEKGVMGIAVPELHRNGAKVDFGIPRIQLSYEGALDPDGKTIRGTMTQGDMPKLQFNLVLQ